jgi:hypothetical protein
MPGGTVFPSSPESTVIAHATINGAGDTITVLVIRPADMPSADRTLKPAIVRIVWPAAPTVVDPRRFPDTAMLTRLFAEAATTLAGIKAKLGKGSL